MTQKTITVTVPASEPQTTTKEINVPSYWKSEEEFMPLKYMLILTPSCVVNINKFASGSYMIDNSNTINMEFMRSSYKECSKHEASQAFLEANKHINDLLFESVFGDQQEQFDQAIKSYTEQNFVTDKPIIERKHTEFK